MTSKTRVRYSIVALALLINVVSYTDRACLAVAGPDIQKAFHFNPAQMGLVYSIFSVSYFLGQTPWGALADRRGARRLVAFAVGGWSVFTAITAAAWSFTSLLAIRFVFGGLEAALSPSIAAAFNRWVPVSERATAFGAFLGGGRLGAALTPPIASLLILRYGWRLPFVAFGAVGLAAASAWYFWYRDRPEEHWRVSPAELAVIRSGAAPARLREKTRRSELLRSSRLWCLLGVAFGATFLWQFYITWFPTYLRERRGLSVEEASFYAGLPFLFGVIANWAGGLLTDFVGQRTDVRTARNLVGLFSLTGAALLMSAGIWASQPRLSAALMGLAAGSIDLYLGAAWSSATDIGGPSGGAVAGMMNAASNCAGFASPALMGWVLQASNNWDSVLLLSVATTCAAAVLWWFVNPRQEAGCECAA